MQSRCRRSSTPTWRSEARRCPATLQPLVVISQFSVAMRLMFSVRRCSWAQSVAIHS